MTRQKASAGLSASPRTGRDGLCAYFPVSGLEIRGGGGGAERGPCPLRNSCSISAPAGTRPAAPAGWSWPHSPRRPGLSSSRAEAQTPCRREKPAEPRVWSVGSHILACSPLLAPTPARRPGPRGTRPGPQPDTGPPGKGRGRNRPGTAPTSLPHHSDHRHASWSWTAWVRASCTSGCLTPAEMSLPLL